MSRSVLRVVRREADRLLVLAAIAVTVYAVWFSGAASGMWLLVLTAGGIATAGSLPPVRGFAAGFAMLWAAFGTMMGLSALSLLSIGPLLLVGAALLAGAIATAPDRTGLASRWQPDYSFAYCAALVVVLGIVFV